MKRKIFLIMQACLFFLAACFNSCNDVIENEDDRDSKGTSIVPNPMTVGEKVTISGPNFKDATEVVFPGGVSVTDLIRAGNFQISMIVPSGTAIKGNIIVKLPGYDFVIPREAIIVTSKTYMAIPEFLEVNKENGLFWIGPNDKLEIRGEGLGAVAAIILPGDIRIDAMNLRKSESLIELIIPMGVARIVSKVQLLMHNGEIQYSVNEVDFSGEGYIPPELLPFCGRSFKVWSWDEEVTEPFGNGAYGSDNGPNWWKPNIDVYFGVHGTGAKMAFQLPNKMTLTLNDGTVYDGKFKVDMTQGVGSWSSGKLEVTSGDEALSIIGGTYGPYNGSYSLYPKIFDIVKLTNAEMVLAFRYPEEPATANFFLYRVLEDEGEGSGGGGITVPDDLKPWVGDGSKVWTWMEDGSSDYGMAEALSDIKNIEWWWSVSGDPGMVDPLESYGAKMTFSYFGKGKQILTKELTDGTKVEGTFDITMQKNSKWETSIGKLTTDKVTVLEGRNTNDSRPLQYEYNIFKLTDQELILGVLAPDMNPTTEGWGEATFWRFKSVQ